MNCPNCGAPLNNPYKCEYCGLTFSVAEGSINTIMLNLNNETIYCYLDSVETEIIRDKETGRDLYGKVMYKDPVVKRTFILKEL